MTLHWKQRDAVMEYYKRYRKGIVSLGEVSRRTGVSKTSVWRIFDDMTRRGYFWKGCHHYGTEDYAMLREIEALRLRVQAVKALDREYGLFPREDPFRDFLGGCKTSGAESVRQKSTCAHAQLIGEGCEPFQNQGADVFECLDLFAPLDSIRYPMAGYGDTMDIELEDFDDTDLMMDYLDSSDLDLEDLGDFNLDELDDIDLGDFGDLDLKEFGEIDLKDL